jgi:hypothetical protein
LVRKHQQFVNKPGGRTEKKMGGREGGMKKGREGERME